MTDSDLTPQASGSLQPSSPQEELVDRRPRGSTVDPRYMNRKPNSYPVMEHEFNVLAIFSGWTTVFFSAGTTLISFAVSIWVEVAFQDDLTPNAALLNERNVWLFGFGLASIVLAGLFSLHRRAEVWRIKREAERDTPPVTGETRARRKGVWPTVKEWWGGTPTEVTQPAPGSQG